MARRTRSPEGGVLGGLSKKQQHFIIYVLVIALVLVVFQPGLVLGVVIGALAHKYYTDHISPVGARPPA